MGVVDLAFAYRQLGKLFFETTAARCTHEWLIFGPAILLVGTTHSQLKVQVLGLPVLTAAQCPLSHKHITLIWV